MADISPFAPFDRQANFEAQLLKGAQSEKDLATQGAIQDALQRRIGHNTMLNTMEQGKNTLANTLGGLGVISPHGANLSGLPATPGGGDLLSHMRRAADAKQFASALDDAAKSGAYLAPKDLFDVRAPIVFGHPTSLLAARGTVPTTTDTNQTTQSNVGPSGGVTNVTTIQRKVPDPSGALELSDAITAARNQAAGRQRVQSATQASAPPAPAPAPAKAAAAGAPPASAPTAATTPAFTGEPTTDDGIIVAQVQKLLEGTSVSFNTSRDTLEVDSIGGIFVNGRRVGTLKNALPPGYVVPGKKRVVHVPPKQGLDLSNPPIGNFGSRGSADTWAPR